MKTAFRYILLFQFVFLQLVAESSLFYLQEANPANEGKNTMDVVYDGSGRLSSLTLPGKDCSVTAFVERGPDETPLTISLVDADGILLDKIELQLQKPRKSAKSLDDPSLDEYRSYWLYNLVSFFDRYSFFDFIEPHAHEFARYVFGDTFLLLSGFYKDTSETGVHGKGEIHDKIRITMINGILNDRISYKQTIDAISKLHRDANIHYIFDATDGWCSDVIKCVLIKSGYISPQAHRVAELWRRMIDEMGGIGQGGLIFHYAHSLGASQTKAALKLISPEEKQMIRIFTFGSPSIINDDDLDGVYNFISVRDGVSLFDPAAFISALLGWNDQIHLVGDPLGIPLVDHLILNDTYMDVIKTLAEQITKDL